MLMSCLLLASASGTATAAGRFWMLKDWATGALCLGVLSLGLGRSPAAAPMHGLHCMVCIAWFTLAESCLTLCLYRQEGDLGPVYGFQWRHFGAQYKDMHTDYSGAR